MGVGGGRSSVFSAQRTQSGVGGVTAFNWIQLTTSFCVPFHLTVLLLYFVTIIVFSLLLVFSLCRSERIFRHMRRARACSWSSSGDGGPASSTKQSFSYPSIQTHTHTHTLPVISKVESARLDKSHSDGFICEKQSTGKIVSRGVRASLLEKLCDYNISIVCALMSSIAQYVTRDLILIMFAYECYNSKSGHVWLWLLCSLWQCDCHQSDPYSDLLLLVVSTYLLTLLWYVAVVILHVGHFVKYTCSRAH